MPTLPLQIGAPVFILKCPRMLVLLTLPLSAWKQWARLSLCPGTLVPWTCNRLCHSAGVCCFPIFHKRQRSIYNQSYWHPHRPQSCTLLCCFCSCENWGVGKTLRKLPSVATHRRNAGVHQVSTPKATADLASLSLHTLPPLIAVNIMASTMIQTPGNMASPPYEMANTSRLNNKPKQQGIETRGNQMSKSTIYSWKGPMSDIWHNLICCIITYITEMNCRQIIS